MLADTLKKLADEAFEAQTMFVVTGRVQLEEPDGRSYETGVIGLWIGQGYFSGCILEIKFGVADEGNRRIVELPLEIGIARFLKSDYPKVHEKMALVSPETKRGI